VLVVAADFAAAAAAVVLSEKVRSEEPTRGGCAVCVSQTWRTKVQVADSEFVGSEAPMRRHLEPRLPQLGLEAHL